VKRSRKANRATLAGIVVPVLVAAGSVGTFLLTAPHSHPVNQAGTAVLPGNIATPVSLPSPSPSPTRHKHRSHKHKRHAAPSVTEAHIFVGVAVRGSIVSGVDSFSHATGAHISLVEIYAAFGASFPQAEARRATSVGASPLLQWDPKRVPVGQIAAGNYNSYVRHYADAVKAFGHYIVLSFGHEMNGSWNNWGAGHVSPATFVTAWHRIHNIFAKQHVTNVSWSWDPSHTADEPHPWWPGPAYVDQIGIDGYQRPGQTFADIFASRLADIRGFASKPIYIAETSVAPSAGQARQVRGLFDGVWHYHLSGFVWFDIDGLEAWRLEGRPAAIRAFRSSVSLMNG
jgi:hypothetical protein